MRLFTSIGIILLVVVLQSHCQVDTDLTYGSTQQNLDLVSRSVTNLAQKISLAISSPKSKTELFSPVSIAGALSLLLLGSGGTTRDELINLLGFQNQPISFTDIHKSFGRLFQELVSNDPTMTTRIPWRENDKCNNPDYDEEDEPSYQPARAPTNQGTRGKRDTDSHYISVANGVFVDSNLQLNPSYEKLTKKLYDGEISRKPLESDPVRSSHEINKWVQYATRNKIQDIVSPDLVRDAPMVLASALYFKAKWETMFIEPDTRPRPFYVNGRESPPVDVFTMATSGCFPFYADKQLDVKIVGLPYQERKTTMYIIMPNQSDRQKIRTFQNRVDVSQLDEFIDRMVVKTGTILLPKMKLENSLRLRDVLLANGLQRVFSPQLSNLTAITKAGRIFENGTRSNKPPTTSTPLPKPTPPPQPTNPQDIYNSRGPPTAVQSPVAGNPVKPKPSPPIQPIPTADLPPANPPFLMALNKNDCNLINNCNHNGFSCNCYVNEPILTDERGCYSKPWVIQQSCPPEIQEMSHKDFMVCRAIHFNKYFASGGQCPQHCVQQNQWCYCCNPSPISAPTQPPTTTPASIDYQQNSNPPAPFDIGIRFNPNTGTNPPPPSVEVCNTIYTCNRNYECQELKRCALVNPQGIPPVKNFNRRNKRQTPNNASPPNLYVGNVLHKVSLDVDEQGTEGGAVTAVVIDRISSAFNLRVDGPFLIYLRNDVTKLPLFYGAVFDPRP